jgi:phytoene desaturase
VGFNKIDNISHHALFFDVDFQHAKDIYDEPQWPKNLFCELPSLTDKTAALLKEWNRAFLIPLAPGINDTEALREIF